VKTLHNILLVVLLVTISYVALYASIAASTSPGCTQ
jgi:hypothetical protein